MAAATQAFRRHLTWTLIAASLAAAILTGCGDKQQEPGTAPPPSQTQAPEPAPTGSEPDDGAILQELSQRTTSWLDRFGRSSSTNLGCPGSNTAVAVTGPGATASSDVEACVVPADANGVVHLRVHNRTGVPITVSGSSAVLWWTVQPDATVDVRLRNPRFGDVITFKPELRAGLTMAVIDSLTHRVPPGMEWLECATRPDTKCLVGLATKLLPPRVEIRGWTLPAQRIAELLTKLWDQAPLVRAFWDQAAGRDGGHLTLRQAAP